ncbi:MAG TPA: sialate O-acetylesterase [Candidatus Hydrogenedentes bacterium]|nr:sialate O-acetylesterase [Candidatus Hydrogenedentota bacterium]
MSKLRVFLACLLGSIAIAVGVSAEVTLHPLFSDHMVLQQGERIPVWGKAAPGENVTVTIDRRKDDACADENGNWMVKLRSLRAGGPYEMTVAGKNNTLTVKDVLVGEVWVGSGQSNMAMNVQSSNNAEQEIANANYPNIRLFQVPTKTADTPQETVEAQWQLTTPETIPGFSAAAYFFGRELHQQLNVPVGLIHTSWGGTPSEAWTSLCTLKATPEAKPILDRWDDIIAKYPQALEEFNKQMEEWNKAAEQAKKDGKEAPAKPRAPLGPDHPHRPASLYNAMIAPLIPYAIRGAIWYQGESNAGRAYQYRAIFPAMIEDWREHWNQGNFPFLFVQLANFTERKPDPGDSDWAELREAQSMTLKLKNTGMAVIIDIGDAADIHPKNKQDVGKRLAYWALDKTYKKDVVPSGPLYDSARFRSGKATIRFDYADGGLVSQGGELKGFAIAGPDQKFVWAKAEVAGKKKVTVWSEQVPNPVAVRYGWANNPECTLYNKAGLPASPFRTDEWPGITINNK